MSRYPGAVWRPLPKTSYNAGARTANLGLILHVQQGNGSPVGWFANPASKASSTFWVSKTGLVEQYMEAGRDKSWAQSAGNPLYDSVETEGWVGEPLTAAQITALAALCAWEHATFGMPLVAIEVPGQRGFGWHGMGGVAWGNHPGCPGDLRKAQRGQILGVATVSNTTTTGGVIPTAPGALTATPPEDDMFSPDDSQRLIDVANALGRLETIYGAADARNRAGEIDDTHDKVLEIHAGVAGLYPVLSALKGGQVDTAALADALKTSLGAAVAADLAARLAS